MFIDDTGNYFKGYTSSDKILVLNEFQESDGPIKVACENYCFNLKNQVIKL